MNKICYGCGAKLQNDDKEKEGFIPENKINESFYCQRCFRLIHYGQNTISKTPKSINSIINSINKDNKYVLFLVDFITLNNDIIKIFKKIKKRKTLVVSKCDIIPKNIRYENIIKVLRETYKINDDISLTSSVNNYGINALINYLFYEKINECYIVGESNSGKSTLINKIIDSTDSHLHKITTSYIPNTTLDFIRLKLNDNLTIIDSPGFILDDKVNINVINKNNLKKQIKPKTYQMKKGEALKLENIYFRFNENTSITLYMNNDINVKKHYKNEEYSDKIKTYINTDIVIKGLGFINIKEACEIEIKNIDKKYIEIRDSIFRK